MTGAGTLRRSSPRTPFLVVEREYCAALTGRSADGNEKSLIEEVVGFPYRRARLKDRSDVLQERDFTSTDRWSYAIAVRESDRGLHQRLDRAIARLIADRAIEGILRHYGISGREGAPTARRTG